MPPANRQKEGVVVSLHERAVWTTRKHRAEDLVRGDVVRNRFGKWDVAEKVTPQEGGLYVHIMFETGTDMQARTVALVDVQVVKPS